MSGNNQLAINDCLNDLNSVNSYIQANPLDSMCQYLISYSVIRACGTIEIITKNILYDYLSCGAKNETMIYLEKQILDSSWNPSTGRIKSFIEKLNQTWANQFQTAVNGTREQTSLNSLVNLRNQFAHGQPITSSINDVINYFNDGCIIMNHLDSIIV